MNRSTFALARVYVRLAWTNPVTWLAMVAALLYTVLTSSTAAVTLAANGIRLHLLEVALYDFNDAYYLTFGLLFCFIIVASSMFYERETERLALWRMTHRRDVWVARVLALLGMASLFLAAVATTWLLVSLPSFPASAGWSEGYRSVLTLTQANRDGLPPVYYLAADSHFATTTTPIALVATQSALFLLVFWLVGTVCAVVGQAIRQQAVALVALFAYLFSFLVISASPTPQLAVATPQSILLLATHTPHGLQHASYFASFAVSFVVLLLLSGAGVVQARRMDLG